MLFKFCKDWNKKSFLKSYRKLTKKIDKFTPVTTLTKGNTDKLIYQHSITLLIIMTTMTLFLVQYSIKILERSPSFLIQWCLTSYFPQKRQTKCYSRTRPRVDSLRFVHYVFTQINGIADVNSVPIKFQEVVLLITFKWGRGKKKLKVLGERTIGKWIIMHRTDYVIWRVFLVFQALFFMF